MPVLAVLIWVRPACPADGHQLLQACEAIQSLELAPDSTWNVAGAVLEHTGLTLEFQKGRLAWFDSVTIDGTPHTCAAYFEGQGRIKFTAPLRVEQSNLRRFFKQDSLLKSFDRMLLLFSDEVRRELQSQAVSRGKPFKKKQRQRARELFEELYEDDEHYFIFELLRSLVEPQAEPFLLVHVKPKGTPRIYYAFIPWRREQVGLWRHHDLPGESYMEQICGYAAGVTPNRRGINGHRRSLLAGAHYDIDAALSLQGMFRARTRAAFAIGETGSQFGELYLHPDLRIRSITDEHGDPVAHLGHDKARDNRRLLYLFLSRRAEPGDTVHLEFVYDGEIAREVVGLFYVTAGAEWYPSPVERERATFDLSFRTPRDYAFVATGEPVGEVGIGDTVLTRWKVTRPTRNVSFAIGPMERFEFGDSGQIPVDIYFSEDLHVNVGPALSAAGLSTGRHMEEKVAFDLLGALNMFDREFGPYPYDRLRAAEIMAYHGEAFPGFLHMGYPTWVNNDARGLQQVFRAHEVAHQWWGVEVGYETYRDQWLSEAFSEYSALLYLQGADGTDKMLDVLRLYRDDLFSVRHYLFGAGPRSGAIAMGYRLHSSQTEGDYNLVVYKKGAFVLHMLRSLMVELETMDESRFFGLLRTFYERYRGREANTEEFEELAEEFYGGELDWFFEEWVYGSQLPTYRFDYDVEEHEDGTFAVRGRIEPRDVDSTFRMPIPISVELSTGARVYRRIDVGNKPVPFEITGLVARPEKVRLNPFESVLARID